MDMNQAVAGQFLKKEDLAPNGTNAVISFVRLEEVGQEKEKKYILYWQHDQIKPLNLNKTNIRILIALFGADSDAWSGQTVQVYNDLSINFNGAIGGCRLRLPPQPLTPQNAPAQMVAAVVGGQTEAFQTVAGHDGQAAIQQAPPPGDDDIPF